MFHCHFPSKKKIHTHYSGNSVNDDDGHYIFCYDEVVTIIIHFYIYVCVLLRNRFKKQITTVPETIESTTQPPTQTPTNTHEFSLPF